MKKYQTPLLFFIETPMEDILGLSYQADGYMNFQGSWFDE